MEEVAHRPVLAVGNANKNQSCCVRNFPLKKNYYQNTYIIHTTVQLWQEKSWLWLKKKVHCSNILPFSTCTFGKFSIDQNNVKKQLFNFVDLTFC
jgi:hypothetical protein